MINKKGFTLVELLAVIVVLAIIMIIAVPSVMDSMNNARKSSLKTFALKALNQASTKYQTDIMVGGVTGSKCYTIDDLFEAGARGNYKGYVTVTPTNGTTVTSSSFQIVVTDGNYTIPYAKGTYTILNGNATDTVIAGKKDGSTTVASTCPTT